VAAIDFILRNGLQVYGNVGIGTTSNAGIGSGNVAAIFGKTYHAGNIQLGNTNTISGILFADGSFQSTAPASNVAAFSASNIRVTSTTTDSTFYVGFFEAVSGNIGARANNSFTYNPSTNTLSLGAITSAAWDGQTISATKGGTGRTAYAQGDLLYASSASSIGVISWIGPDTGVGNVLVNGIGGPSWGTVDLSSISAVKNTLAVGNGGTGSSTQLTTGSIVFAGASGVYSQNNSQLFWDDTNNRLGVGISSPSQSLDVNGSVLLRSNAQILGNLVVNNSGRIGNLSVTNTTAATSTTSGALVVAGGASIAGNVWAGNAFITSNVGVGTSVMVGGYVLTVNGALAATSKSFVIDHPTKPGMKLQHASLEGPENGVYLRGKLTNCDRIMLPDYWKNLIDLNTITVNLTPVGKHEKLYVREVTDEYITVGIDTTRRKPLINCFYTVYAERTDIPKLRIEI